MMSKNRDFTKKEALKLLDSTIKEMQQSLSQKDDSDILVCDLGAEINLMNDLYRKLCKVFYCKPYGTDLSGFIQDLQCRMRLPFLHLEERYARFRIYKRFWEIEIMNDSLHITYSDNLEVDGVTLEHGESFSVDALIFLDILKVEIIQSFREVLPLLKAEEMRRKNKKGYINSIPSEDVFMGRDVNTIGFKKGDIVWCVDPKGRDKMTLGIIFSQPPSDVWYQQRLKELRKVFGEDYSFEMDVHDDSYVVYIPKKESTKPYDSWFRCESSCVFPVTEKIPDDISCDLRNLLYADDHLHYIL